MATEEELMDERMRKRLERLEREKEKQNLKHRKKVEETDWLSILNKGDDYARSTKTH